MKKLSQRSHLNKFHFFELKLDNVLLIIFSWLILDTRREGETRFVTMPPHSVHFSPRKARCSCDWLQYRRECFRRDNCDFSFYSQKLLSRGNLRGIFGLVFDVIAVAASEQRRAVRVIWKCALEVTHFRECVQWSVSRPKTSFCNRKFTFLTRCVIVFARGSSFPHLLHTNTHGFSSLTPIRVCELWCICEVEEKKFAFQIPS